MPSDKYLRPSEETAPLSSSQQYLKMPACMAFFYPVAVKPCYLFHPETCYERQPESVFMSSGRSHLSQENLRFPLRSERLFASASPPPWGTVLSNCEPRCVLPLWGGFSSAIWRAMRKETNTSDRGRERETQLGQKQQRWGMGRPRHLDKRCHPNPEPPSVNPHVLSNNWHTLMEVSKNAVRELTTAQSWEGQKRRNYRNKS